LSCLFEVSKWLETSFEVNGKCGPAYYHAESEHAIVRVAKLEWKEGGDQNHVKVEVKYHDILNCVSDLASALVLFEVNEDQIALVDLVLEIKVKSCEKRNQWYDIGKD